MTTVLANSLARVKGQLLKILVVHIRFAEYDRCAGDLRLTNMLRILAERHEVELHILYKPASYLEVAQNAPYRALMAQLGIEVRTGNLRARLRERLYDAVLIEFWYVARPILDEIRALRPDARLIVDTEHVYFQWNHLRALTAGQDPNTPALLKAKKDELDTYARSDLIIATTEEDKALLARENRRLAIFTVPTIHDDPGPMPASDIERKPNSIVFVGNFSNNPANVDGIIYFCDEIFPLIRAAVPAAHLTIVGNRPPESVQSLASDSVTVTGYVPRIDPYLAASTVSICPMRYGTGLKGKITEAMIHGLPVTTTSIGAQGIGARHGEHIMIADTPAEFAECVMQLLQQPDLRQTVSRNGRQLVLRDFSYRAVAARLEAMLSNLNEIPIQRFGQPKRLTLRARFDVTDFLHRHFLWRLR